jgi:hypothetical protein
MADILIDNQAQPTAPASAKSLLYVDATSKELVQAEGTAGLFKTVRPLTNANTADVVANAANTYLTGSGLTIPPALVRAGTILTWRFSMTKTAAGVATPIWTIVVGTAGTVADTARITLTGAAQTAVVDTGFVDIQAVVRSNGAAGVCTGIYTLSHVLSTSAVLGTPTGLCVLPTDVRQATSAGFDMTVSASIWGVCVNPGAASVWTFQHVSATGVAL